MAAKGLYPSVAKPAANVTPCCSAIPTLNILSGNFFSNKSRPVPEGIAPVIATILVSFSACFISVLAKTFEEEKVVANKVPVEGIVVENISDNTNKNNSTSNETKKIIPFKYIIKIADLYFEESAYILKNRLLNEYNIDNIKIKKMSKNRYRIFKGPFNNLDSIKNEYSDIIKLNFENIEIIKL